MALSVEYAIGGSGLWLGAIASTYHGWVYGYKAHVSISVASTTVRVVLGATVTGSACESHALHGRVKDLPHWFERCCWMRAMMMAI